MLQTHTTRLMPTGFGRHCRGWLLLGQLAWLLFVPMSAADNPPSRVALKESPAAVARTQTGVAYEVGGELSMLHDGELTRLPLLIKASMSYHDKQLGNDDQTEDGKLSINRRYVRHYDAVQTEIKIQDAEFSPQLRDSRQVIGVWIVDGQRHSFSPAGHLTRDELDLVETLGDSQLLGLLLPTEAVAIGDQWSVPEAALALLLDIDAIGQTDLQGVLEELDEQTARIEVRGTVHGAIGGVATEIEVKARLQFDRQKELVTRMELLTKEKRAIGHVGPGVDAVSKLRLQRLPLQTDGRLTKAIVDTVAFPPEQELTQLEFEAVNKLHRTIHDRNWHVTGDQPSVTILRLLRRGELIAQCNITPQSARVEGTPTDLESYRDRVHANLGDRFIQFVESSQEKDGDRTVSRVVADGKVDELPIRWIYYLIRGEGDAMLSVSFTVEADLIESFGDSDRQLVERIALIPQSEPTAAARQETAGKAQPELNR